MPMNAYFNVTVKITKAEMLVSSFGSTLFLNLFANRHPETFNLLDIGISG